jgi:hypothetical protein
METVLPIIGVLILTVLVIGNVLIFRDTKRRGKWGINSRQVFCPWCNFAMPKVRWPANLRQALWGGWTCPRCGVEMDKWGRPL